jgi:hypothetical protein
MNFSGDAVGGEVTEVTEKIHNEGTKKTETNEEEDYKRFHNLLLFAQPEDRAPTRYLPSLCPSDESLLTSGDGPCRAERPTVTSKNRRTEDPKGTRRDSRNIP